MPKVSKALMVALLDCACFHPDTYIWKPKSMEKLEAMGLVRSGPYRGPLNWYRGKTAFTITEAGRNGHQ